MKIQRSTIHPLITNTRYKLSLSNTIALTRKALGFSFFALLPTITQASQHSLVIAIDGLRGDGIESTATPHLDQLINGTWAEGYKGAFAHYAQTMTDAAPNSGPNHVGIMTGVTAKKSKVTNNSNVHGGDYATYPHYLKRLEEANPKLKTAYLVTWGTDLQIPSHADVIVDADDASNTQRTVQIMNGTYSTPNWPQGTTPDAVFLFLDDVDGAGHSCCFTPGDDGYRAEITEVDSQIGQVLTAIKNRPTFASEDWQIVMTSDHGGRGSSHGIHSADNYTIPFLVASKTVKQGYLQGVPRNYDAAVTAMAHMGLAIPSNLDGQVQGVNVLDTPPENIETDLVAYLQYEGDYSDTSDKHNHAAIGGGSPDLISGGKFGGYVGINGTNEYVTFGSIHDLDFGPSQDFTLMTWYRVTGDQSGDPVIMGNKDWQSGANRGTLLLANEDNGDDFGINIASYGGDRKDIDPIDYTFNGWWMIVATFDRDGASILYAGSPDGRLYMIADDISDVGDINSALPWNIGQDGTGTYKHNLKADLDDTAIWRRALSIEEVKSVFNGGVGNELKHLMEGHSGDTGNPPTLPAALDSSYTFSIGQILPVTISAVVSSEKCSLQWDNTLISGERNAKFDCNNPGDKMLLRVDAVSTLNNGDIDVTGIISADGGFGQLEWDGYKNLRGERNAKFDQNSAGDTVIITFTNNANSTIVRTHPGSETCGLEWNGRKLSGERTAKWDCHPRMDTFLFETAR
ncbi:MAG: alkaline phosphatase family protein [Cellvibrionales bacterium]|nr:alkaline phosphatase family protein [Cellvibrionales bacterium]